jgi:hypothetical protein
MSKNMLSGTVERAGFVKDPLLKEIRAFRDHYAAAFHYDVYAMGRDLRKRESASGRKLAKRGICKIGK